MEIGDKLRVVIESKYPKIKDYSSKTGMNYTQLSQYLNNTKKPSLAFLERFFLEFNEVDLNWLFRDSEAAESFVKEDSSKYYSPVDNKDIITRIEFLLADLKSNLSQK